jgi:hypothetical protein
MYRKLTVSAMGQTPVVYKVPTTFTLPKAAMTPLDFLDVDGVQHQVATTIAFEVSLTGNIAE